MINDYLTTYVDADYAALFLPELHEDRWPHIKELTKIGLEEGVIRYLKTNDEQAIGLRNFYFDRTTQDTIVDRMKGCGYADEDIQVYAEDMSEGFATYVLMLIDGDL
jgi:hypothetical protein